MGRRADAILLIAGAVVVIEFKIGASKYETHAINQAWDYALDLKNFHSTSHLALIAPILLCSEAPRKPIRIQPSVHADDVLRPILCNPASLREAIDAALDHAATTSLITSEEYIHGRYSPTPTIIEAAIALYNQHSVEEITRSDASATNLSNTSSLIGALIRDAKDSRKKIICFVTGVPGAGKTLVGLDVATEHLDESKNANSVYLSGNAPLVAVLQEALSRDRVKRELERGSKITKSKAKQAVKTFIQNIHHYRDEYLRDLNAPFDHVAIFDEAQRAWDKPQTVKFMQQKKKISGFSASEPEFLISCLDRHPDWAVIICLVGGGQEINTGEAGIKEWLTALEIRFSHWEVHISPNLTDREYDALPSIQRLAMSHRVHLHDHLHLSTSMRSFRAENLSGFIKHLLDLDTTRAKSLFQTIRNVYPIKLTRDIGIAKDWLRQMARGNERYGIVVSSQAQRLKPYAIDVKSPVDPVKWFLNERDDIRSSYFLEDVATEFHIQGLELDWVCVAWDADLRLHGDRWTTYSFKGSKWQNIKQDRRKQYLINAYRVLLTRARQGMVILVPEGAPNDHTRKSEFYNETYEYLVELGLETI
jgi:DUF2075 family protein